LTSTDRVLVVAPSWVGDAILSEPLVARLRATRGDASIDVLAPAWCAPVYARMQGVGRIYDSALRHGRVDLAQRKALAGTLSAQRYTQAVILPNSWKSALVPWLAHPAAHHYTGKNVESSTIGDVGPPRVAPGRHAALAADAGAPGATARS
jgi:heptosyltransferase-2